MSLPYSGIGRPRKAPAPPAGSAAAAGAAGGAPVGAQEVATILRDMGATSYHPQVIPQLLELSCRLVTDILSDAQRFARHRTKDGDEGVPALSVADIALAKQSRIDFCAAGPPPREFFMELALTKNADKLPRVEQSETGVRVPKHTLTQQNYHVMPQSRKRRGGGGAGPWDLPVLTPATVEAARAAKVARINRKHETQGLLLGQSGAVAAPTAFAAPLQQTAGTGSGGGDDDDEFG